MDKKDENYEPYAHLCAGPFGDPMWSRKNNPALREDGSLNFGAIYKPKEHVVGGDRGLVGAIARMVSKTPERMQIIPEPTDAPLFRYAIVGRSITYGFVFV